MYPRNVPTSPGNGNFSGHRVHENPVNHLVADIANNAAYNSEAEGWRFEPSREHSLTCYQQKTCGTDAEDHLYGADHFSQDFTRIPPNQTETPEVVSLGRWLLSD